MVQNVQALIDSTKAVRELLNASTGAVTLRLIGRQSGQVRAVVTSSAGLPHDFGFLAALDRMQQSCPDILPIYADQLLGYDSAGELSAEDRRQAFIKLIPLLSGLDVTSIVCAPLSASACLCAVVLKEVYGVPLCSYIADDTTIRCELVNSALVEEVLRKSSLRLAASAELRNVYEAKYAQKIWVVPSVVPDQFITTDPSVSGAAQSDPTVVGALLGGMRQSWLDSLRETLKASGMRLDWHAARLYDGNLPESADLDKDGIKLCSAVEPESQLISVLKQYPYAVVASGYFSDTLEPNARNRAIAEFGLPGQLSYLVAACNTPIILLGDARTAAAKFVKKLGLGVTADYQGQALAEAVELVTGQRQQEFFRVNAARAAAHFSDAGFDQFFWQSLAAGAPVDQRFEQFLRNAGYHPSAISDQSVPGSVLRGHVPAYLALNCLYKRNYNPAFVVDVGSSTGAWSRMAQLLFPEARIVLIEPLLSRYRQRNWDNFANQPDVDRVAVALSNAAGKETLYIDETLYGSSLMIPHDLPSYERLEVETRKLDDVARTLKLTGSGILKISVHGGEDLVLEGAQSFLKQVDVVSLHIQLISQRRNRMSLSQMLELLSSHGFDYFDDAGSQRSPNDGLLLQKGLMLVKRALRARLDLETWHPPKR